MPDSATDIRFDRNKTPALDFDIFPFEGILQRRDLNHDPRKSHRVHFYVLILVTSGIGKHSIDFKEYDLKKGSILTIRKNQTHSFHSGRAKGFLLIFTEEYVLSYLEQTSSDKIAELFNELLYSQHSQLQGYQLKETLVLVQQIQEEFSQPIDGHTPGIIRNLLQVLTRKIYRIRNTSAPVIPDNKYTRQFMAFQRLVELHCQEFRSVQYYADQLNVTPRTLNNITHALINRSAKKFIDEISILQIKRLLINTTLSIKEIAHRSGFNEPSNLFKFFKRHTDQTPESFRSTHSAT